MIHISLYVKDKKRMHFDIERILFFMGNKRRFAALVKQVWHLVVQTPLVRGTFP